MADAKKAGNRKTKGSSVGEKFDGDTLIETQSSSSGKLNVDDEQGGENSKGLPEEAIAEQESFPAGHVTPPKRSFEASTENSSPSLKKISSPVKN